MKICDREAVFRAGDGVGFRSARNLECSSIASVGFGEDSADRGFVKAFPTFPSLEDFQVGTGSTVDSERVGDFRGEVAFRDHFFEAVVGYGPSLRCGEGLPEHGEIRERVHDCTAGGLELVADDVVEEFAFEVVESSGTDGGAVQRAPESNGGLFSSWGKGLTREVRVFFARGEVDVDEQDDVAVGVLEDLGAPSGFGTGVESFSAFETHGEEELQKGLEDFAGTAVGVVIVVRPTDSDGVLPRLLPAGSGVPRLVERSFGLEEDFDSRTVSDRFGCVGPCAVDLAQDGGFGKGSISLEQRFAELLAGVVLRRGAFDGKEFAGASTFDGHQFADREVEVSAPVRAARRAVDMVEVELVGAGEILDRFDPDGHGGGVAILEPYTGQACLVGFPNGVAGYSGLWFKAEVGEETGVDAVFRKDPVVDQGGDIDADGGHFSTEECDFGVVGREIVEKGAEESFGGGEAGPGIGDGVGFHGVEVPCVAGGLLLCSVVRSGPCG